MAEQNKSVDDLKKLNSTTKVLVNKADLPLHCPMDESAIWCSHPRVFLAIEEKKDAQIRCPYCGTLYIMQ